MEINILFDKYKTYAYLIENYMQFLKNEICLYEAILYIVRFLSWLYMSTFTKEGT